jgi:hypothetical protein
MYTVGRLNYDPSKAQIIECQRGGGVFQKIREITLFLHYY